MCHIELDFTNVSRQNNVFKITVLSLKHPYFYYCKVYYTMTMFLIMQCFAFSR
jgi:hypothetical protein